MIKDTSGISFKKFKIKKNRLDQLLALFDAGDGDVVAVLVANRAGRFEDAATSQVFQS